MYATSVGQWSASLLLSAQKAKNSPVSRRQLFTPGKTRQFRDFLTMNSKFVLPETRNLALLGRWDPEKDQESEEEDSKVKDMMVFFLMDVGIR